MKFVTVGVIVKNEEKHIAETLNHLLDQNYPKNMYEILIIDGNSTDRTQEIVKKISAKNKNVRMIIEPWKKGSHGMARNLAADSAKGEYLAFTDGDCIAKNNWLGTLVNSIEAERKSDSKVAAVGGIRTPVKTAVWKENLMNHCMGTFFGSGGSGGFVKTEKKYVDSVPNYNAIYVKDIVKKERYSIIGVGEDYEFNLRLNSIGYKIIFNKEAVVYHHQENSFSKFSKQMYNYGKAQTRIFKMIGKIRYFAVIAPLFLLFLIFGPFVAIASQTMLYAYATGIGIYLLVDLIFTIIVAARIRKPYSLLAFFVYPLQHISYGLGCIAGIFR